MAALAVRYSGEETPLIAAVKQRARAINNELPIHSIQPMEQVIWSSISQPRFYTTLLSVFAALGLLLALVGVYGVLHYAVSRRTHEFGVRMALGANASDVLSLVFRQALGIVLPGLALGLAASMALTRFLESELFEVSPTDPLVLGGLSIALAAAAVLASYIPALRATRLHPVHALRYE
jgi:ABC-type antimicrobial peptide transport system permease subunit